MANPEILRILAEGAQCWNEWRKRSPGIVRPDLQNAQLRGVQLGGVNLTRAELTDANLAQANLAGADLAGARLTYTNCFGTRFTAANLSGAELVGANFGHADLSEANLCGALLADVDFRFANFRGADLRDCVLGWASFAGVDLSAARGLSSVMHQGPSSIGIDTIYNSKGRIPDEFLRKAGVPESLAHQIPALVGALQRIQLYSCFISYSSQDQAFADRLYEDLLAEGVRCWLASEDLKIGDRFRERIEDSIRAYERVLLVLSNSSICSDWVRSEVEAALEKERHAGGDSVLFPIRLDEEVMAATTAWVAEVRRTRHIGDFTNWSDHDDYQVAFQRLIRDLSHSESGDDSQAVRIP